LWKCEGSSGGERKCDKCKTGKVRMLQEDLQNALRQIDELKARNRELEAKLLMAGSGKRGTMPTKCVVVGDSMLRNVGAELEDMTVESLPGIKTKQLHRVIEKMYLVSPETVIIHVGTNDMRTTRKLDFVMGEVYELVSTTKKKLPISRLVLSGVLRRKDVS
jgi:hypothetical protein